MPKNQNARDKIPQTKMPPGQTTPDIKNYRIFIPKTFHSQERKVPMENFHFWDFSFPGTKPFVPRERKGTFILGPFCSQELSFLGLFVPGNFRSPDLSFPYLPAQFYNSSLGLVIV